MSHPQYSIVIPAYNETARIERALSSVSGCIRQRGWDAEVLVVDDGSTDDTAALVESWAAEHAGGAADPQRAEPGQGIQRAQRDAAGGGRDRDVYRRRPVVSD